MADGGLDAAFSAQNDTATKMSATDVDDTEAMLNRIKAMEKVTVEEVMDEDVENELKAVQKRNARMILVERPAKEGDTVLFDYAGFVGDEQFEGGSAERQELVLGSGMFIPGFEEQLIGCRAVNDFKVKVSQCIAVELSEQCVDCVFEENAFTVGAGFKMNVFSLDAAYVVATAKSNPLDQTLRFTLSFDMDGLKDLFKR